MASKNASTKPERGLFSISIFGRELPGYWFAIVLIVLLVAMHMGIRLDAKQQTFRLLDSFSWLGDGEFRNSDYHLNGQVESTDILIQPDDGGEDTTISIRRISVDTPGFFWLMRSQIPSFDLGWSWFRRKPKLKTDDDNHFPDANALTIRFEDIEWGGYGMAYALPAVSWVGPYSGAAFEAAGCERDWWWHHSEFSEYFGKPQPSGTIVVSFEVRSPSELYQQVAFGDDATSHILIERRFELDDAADFMDDDPSTWRTTEVRWSFRDHGFVRARNRYCAKQAGITETQFVERHVAAVTRIMASKGLQFDPAMWAAYRRYAEFGKALTWHTRFAPGKALEDGNNLRGAAMFSALNATLLVEGGPELAYQPQIIEPQAIDEDGDFDSLYQVMLHEAGRIDELGDPVAATGAIASTIDGSIAPVSAAATTPSPAGAAAARTMSAVSPTTSPTTLGVAPIAKPEGALSSRQLGKHIGAQVRITLSTGRSYVGLVESQSAQAVILKIRLRGGDASLAFRHVQISDVAMLKAYQAPLELE